ncbi:TPA: DUF551 domain-containing protein [Enterobacter hormaechei]
MSTITREFTKEQLIAKAREQIAFCRDTKITGEGRAHVNQCSALFEIALASLEADSKLSDFVASQESLGVDFERALAENMEELYVPSKSTPPAPVSVPDEVMSAIEHLKQTLVNCNRYNYCSDAVKRIDNAVRAAMLQGAEPVSNRDELPDGWVACSERMPDIGTEIFYFCQDDGLRDCGIVSSSNFSGKGDAELYVHAEGYDLRFGVDISHWMPLPAAPQQEAKNV